MERKQRKCDTRAARRGLAAMLTLIGVLFLQSVQAQTTVKGVIKDEQGELVIGANVVVLGTSTGTTANAMGEFSINAAPDATIRVSFIGYLTQDVPVSGRTFISVSLRPDVTTLDDVVVVGYGSQKKVNMTGAVASVKVDEQLSGRALDNVSSALSGLVPGLQVNVNTAMAGKNNTTLMIRGVGTVNSATPLIVVDGMPDVDINRLNMNDIESISVLKDASSSAVYGSRGANGVILITTKSGAKDKATVSFSTSMAFSTPIKMIEHMTDYAQATAFRSQAALNGGSVNQFRWSSIEEWAAKSYIDPMRYPNTDWMDITSRTGTMQNYNLSASGSTEKSNFYISGGIMDQEGIHITNDFTRYNARFNYDYLVRKNIKVGAKFDGSWTKWTYGPDDGWFTNSASGGLVSAIAGVYPYDAETKRYGGTMMYGETNNIFQPIRSYERDRIVKRDRQDMFGMVNIEWEPLKGLKFMADYSLSYYTQMVRYWTMPWSEWNFQTNAITRTIITDTNASMSNNMGNGYRTLLNGRLTYALSKGKHDFNALLLYAEEYAFGRNLAAVKTNRVHESLTELDAALTLNSITGNSSAWGLRSYVGRLNYAFAGRYLAEMNFRYDGSSKFYDGHQYGFFPSASVGWRFTEETFLEFMKNVVTSGKFRASYGGLGNNSGVGNYEQKESMSQQDYVQNNVKVVGLVNKSMINQALSWETTNVLNLGLDLGFFTNRLMAEIDYYDRYTKGMLRPSDLSTLLEGAYAAPKQNIGEMRNQGIELTLTWRHSLKDFQYSVSFNGSYNANRLKKWNEYLSRGTTFIDMPYGFVYNQINRGGVVQTWQQIYDAPWQAAGSAPGDLLVEDLSGNGTVGGEDMKAYPRLLNIRPTAYFGLNANASWKGIDFAMLWSASTGRKDYWNDHFNRTTLNTDPQAISKQQYYDTWSYTNRGATLPRVVLGARGLNNGNTSYFLDDLSYIRLKNLQVGYTIPTKLCAKIKITSLRIYVSGENLLTFTNYRGLDPEKALTGTTSENDAYPMVRTFSFGLNLVI